MAYTSLFAESRDTLPGDFYLPKNTGRKFTDEELEKMNKMTPEEASLKIPDDFEKDYQSGGHWTYHKILPNGMTVGLSNEEVSDKFYKHLINTAILYPTYEDYDFGKEGNIREVREFSTEEELNNILKEWEKEDPMKESTYKPLFTEESKHNIDEIVKHYLMAALWSTLHNDDEYLDHYYSLSDISEETKEKARRDVERFMKEADPYIGDEASNDQIGHDFFLTRNGHGAGFWDRDFYLDKDKLTEIAKSFGEINFYAEHNVVESEGGSEKGPMDESTKRYKPLFKEDTTDEGLNKVLKEKLPQIFSKVQREYDLYQGKDFAHTPHKSVDGYWAWTDGGLTIEGFQRVEGINGTDIPDKVQTQIDKFIADAEEYARSEATDEEEIMEKESEYLSDIDVVFGIAAHLYQVGGNARHEVEQDYINIHTFISTSEYRHYHGLDNDEIFFDQDIILSKKEDGSYDYEKFARDLEAMAPAIQKSFKGEIVPEKSKMQKTKDLKNLAKESTPKPYKPLFD
jgi:hypothetical protein